MIGIAVFSLLAALLSWLLRPLHVMTPDTRGRARADLKSIQDSVKLYKVNMGAWPEEVRDLIEAPTPPNPNWRGPYLDVTAVPLDPWGRPYRLRLQPEGAMPEVVTYGADGLPGGEGDRADLSR